MKSGLSFIPKYHNLSHEYTITLSLMQIFIQRNEVIKSWVLKISLKCLKILSVKTIEMILTALTKALHAIH